MKYLKRFESSDYDSNLIINAVQRNDLLDLKNCFLGVSDILGEGSDNFGVRIKVFKFKGQVMKSFGIGQVDYEVIIIPKIIDQDFSRRYRATNMDDDMIEEIKNSISLVDGTTDLKFDTFIVEIASGLNYAEGEIGPGTNIKKFKEVSQLFEFLELMKDKVRWVKIFYRK